MGRLWGWGHSRAWTAQPWFCPGRGMPGGCCGIGGSMTAGVGGGVHQEELVWGVCSTGVPSGHLVLSTRVPLSDCLWLGHTAWSPSDVVLAVHPCPWDSAQLCPLPSTPCVQQVICPETPGGAHPSCPGCGMPQTLSARLLGLELRHPLTQGHPHGPWGLTPRPSCAVSWPLPSRTPLGLRWAWPASPPPTQLLGSPPPPPSGTGRSILLLL